MLSRPDLALQRLIAAGVFWANRPGVFVTPVLTCTIRTLSARESRAATPQLEHAEGVGAAQGGGWGAFRWISRWWSDSTDKNPLSKKTSEMAFWQSIERAVRIKNAIN
jgi:hypothetical protein